MTNIKKILEEWEFQKSKWGLGEWDLRFSNGKRNLGYCDGKRKLIFLSRAYMNMNSYDVIRDTLLHEIAHAVQFIKQGKTDHGREWKRIAGEVGCSPERCASTDEINIPRGKYVGICPSCNTVTHFYRKVRRAYACRLCSRNYNTNFKLRMMSIEEFEKDFN